MRWGGWRDERSGVQGSGVKVVGATDERRSMEAERVVLTWGAGFPAAIERGS
ncbi:MAG: hypothetical protein MZV70_50215 [Desulfobacterales bacterium]|nr:hypothetical protein [Desulfobacterales bacterium]